MLQHEMHPMRSIKKNSFEINGIVTEKMLWKLKKGIFYLKFSIVLKINEKKKMKREKIKKGKLNR